MNIKKIKSIIFFSVLYVFIITPSFVMASSSSQSINIKSFVNTSNDSSDSSGNKSQIKVKTIINGEIVEDIDIEEENVAETYYESKVEVKNNEAKIESIKSIDGEEVREVKEIIIKTETNESNVSEIGTDEEITDINTVLKKPYLDEEKLNDQEDNSEDSEIKGNISFLSFLNILLDVFKNTFSNITSLL